MATNKYGLDAVYIEKNLKHILGCGVDNFTPAEMARTLTKLAAVADHEACMCTAQSLEYGCAKTD